MKKKCLIIAEAGVNHNGDLKMALRLCDAAKKIGADAIKFQTWKTEKIITRNVAQADYQIKNTGNKESQYDMLKRLELSYDDFKVIKEYCDEIGILFSSTADEVESLDFLIDLGIPFVKIGSGDIGNVPLLKRAGQSDLAVILSTGMSTIKDVEFAINILKNNGAREITILHCTTNYPCPFEEVNLRAMLSLKERFQLPIGYSDHTKGVEIAIAAVAMGATVIEKHFTLDCKMDGPDQMASTEPIEFEDMIKKIRSVETALGDKNKKPTKSELDISKVVTKRIVAAKSIAKGEMFDENNICVKRNDRGILAKNWDCVLGKYALKDYDFDDGIEL